MRKSRWLALVLALGCGDDDGGDGGAQSSAAATCAKSCARAAAANCPNQPSDCREQCEAQIMATPAACLGAVNGYASCVSTAVFSCDQTGQAEATGCSAQLADWLSCANGGAPVLDAMVARPDASAPDASAADASSADAGAPDATTTDAGAGLSCVVEPAEQGCDVCLKQECCAALSACSGACMQLLGCFQSCVGDTCADSCAAQFPGGVSGVTGIYDCMALDCADACEAELGG